MKTQDLYDSIEKLILEDCSLCPRECHINRFEEGSGYCGMDAGFNIASICLHKGEEPPISGTKGICNIFFAGCNMHCLYCQNHEISKPSQSNRRTLVPDEEVIERIIKILDQGIDSIGFVSPSHMVPQLQVIVRILRMKGYNPHVIYNTNSYDKVETIRELSDSVDVYLPDYKYFTNFLASSLSDAPAYQEIALKALKEMYFQKGSSLRLNENNIAVNGLLIRHLVLPGQVAESKKILKSIAVELSPGVNVSIMSQYSPGYKAGEHPTLNRTIYKAEYDEVVAEMNFLGFRNGWVQDIESFSSYCPDFSKGNPFGD